MFRTSTSGAIKSIQVDFPAGPYVGQALLIEATGIGPGKISAVTSQSLIYTVTNAANIPAGTNIRLEFANLRNPSVPSEMLTVSITTRNSANTIIDGPTTTPAYKIKQIEPNDIPNNSIKGIKLDGLRYLKFKSCNIDWGTVLAGEQKTQICEVSDPEFEDDDAIAFRVMATLHSGNLGLTILQASAFLNFGVIEVTVSVASNSPNDIDVGTVNYSLILFTPI